MVKYWRSLALNKPKHQRDRTGGLVAYPRMKAVIWIPPYDPIRNVLSNFNSSITHCYLHHISMISPYFAGFVIFPNESAKNNPVTQHRPCQIGGWKMFISMKHLLFSGSMARLPRDDRSKSTFRTWHRGHAHKSCDWDGPRLSVGISWVTHH